jgi:hypothetical protein
MNDGKMGENSNDKLMASEANKLMALWQPRGMLIACAEQLLPVISRRTRLGRRRSSLFSVNKRRSSVNQSSVSSSFKDSMTEGSLTGSWTGKIRDGSLICSFCS